MKDRLNAPEEYVGRPFLSEYISSRSKSLPLVRACFRQGSRAKLPCLNQLFRPAKSLGAMPRGLANQWT